MTLAGSLIASILAASVALTAPAAAPPATPPLAAVQPGALQLAADEEGSQYLGVDAKGKPFLLSTARLEVAPLLGSGKLGAPQSLAPRGTVPPRFVLGAAMGRSADEWLLLEGARGLRWFASGKERPLPPLGRLGVAALLVKGTPVVATLAAEAGESPGGFEDKADPPVLMALQGSRWEPILREPFAPASDELGNLGVALHAHGDASLAASSRGQLWLASEHFYRVREISLSGRVLTTLAAGEAKPQYRERSSAEVEQIERAAAEQGFRPEKMKVGQRGLARVIIGITEGTDGRLYILTTRGGERGEGLVLERYDPVELKQDRLALTGNLATVGKLSVGSASDGLYLAAVARPGALWRLSWDQLAAAKWQPAPEVTVQGGTTPPE